MLVSSSCFQIGVYGSLESHKGLQPYTLLSHIHRLLGHASIGQ